MDLTEAKHIDYNISERHPWELARFKVILSILKHTSPYLLKNKINVLDIGCGDTFFVEKLSKYMPLAKFYAVDIAFSNNLINQFKKKFRNRPVKVYNNIEDTNKDSNHIDLVLLLDVIEHIDDDANFLKNLLKYSNISKDTIFLITAPAYQFLFSSHDIFLKHYRRYNNTLLKNTLQKADYKVIKTGYFFTALFIVRVLQVIIKKIKKSSIEKEKGIGEWKSNKIKSSILKTVLILDFKFAYFLQNTGIKLPGLSNYVICKKSV